MSFGTAYATKKRGDKCMAKGGEVKGVHEKYPSAVLNQNKHGGKSSAGRDVAYGLNESAKDRHKEKLQEMKSMPGPTSGKSGFAEGGEVDEMGEPGVMGHESESLFDAVHGKTRTRDFDGPVTKPSDVEQDADMIARIMHKRKEYAEGGEVANDVGVSEADELPAEFDDLVLDDNLEAKQPEDSNEHGDPVSKIMSKRKK